MSQEKTIGSVQQRINKKAIGSRIRAIRGQRSQKAFAKIVNATQSYISDLERGKCLPSVTFLARLKKASGRSYNWILTGKEEPAVPTVPPVEEERRPPTVVGEIDYTYIENLITLLRDADPLEKHRLVKILVSYLITCL